MSCATPILMIPGLAMAAAELAVLDGVRGLDNPGVGGVSDFAESYVLEDVAEFHLRTIQRDHSNTDQLALVGMSMGGMILSILASRYREKLPKDTRFLFLVTSPNLPTNPAISDDLLTSWFAVDPERRGDMARILRPMFSQNFRDRCPERVEDYVDYRFAGGNQQSKEAFVKQMRALMVFQGEASFSKIDPKEATFIGGAQDEILGPTHNADLRRLCPEARHLEISDLGHMINIEQPQRIGDWIYEQISRE